MTGGIANPIDLIITVLIIIFSAAMGAIGIMIFQDGKNEKEECS